MASFYFFLVRTQNALSCCITYWYYTMFVQSAVKMASFYFFLVRTQNALSCCITYWYYTMFVQSAVKMASFYFFLVRTQNALSCCITYWYYTMFVQSAVNMASSWMSQGLHRLHTYILKTYKKIILLKLLGLDLFKPIYSTLFELTYTI